MIDPKTLPPDAIAQVRRAYDDAFNEAWKNWAEPLRYDKAHEAGCAAFRDALAAVLPQEAGAPRRRLGAGPDDIPPCCGCGAAWEVRGGKVMGYTHGATCRFADDGPSRAPSEAAPREPSDAAVRAVANALWGKFAKEHSFTLLRQGMFDAYEIDGLSGSPAFREAPPEEQSSQ